MSLNRLNLTSLILSQTAVPNTKLNVVCNNNTQGGHSAVNLVTENHLEPVQWARIERTQCHCGRSFVWTVLWGWSQLFVAGGGGEVCSTSGISGLQRLFDVSHTQISRSTCSRPQQLASVT